MLWGAFVFLAIAAVTALFSYRNPSTSTYIAKLIFYVSLLIFIVLLFASIFSSAPPKTNTPFLPI
ncbi:transmembrane protein [Legionella lansingensis]|uniref:Transmembrane protein n=1 Tax=Legionella lansingensis TaxID=45067 RepID=A0A0W0VUB2_9GAMM|nr:transmembrane protein [Legionella lansingensis]SNV52477.1 transmembrane protein [Legionella lansingensis]